MSISQVTVSIRRALGPSLIDDLTEIGIELFTKGTGRSPSIGRARKLFGNRSLVDDPVEIISFMVPAEAEDQIVSYVISKVLIYLYLKLDNQRLKLKYIQYRIV